MNCCRVRLIHTKSSLRHLTVSYVCVGQRDGQSRSRRGPDPQTQFLLPQVIELHTLGEGLGLNLNTEDHRRSQRITDNHRRSQTISDDHRRSQTITDDHRRSQTISEDHRRSQTITDDHRPSQTITELTALWTRLKFLLWSCRD